MTDAPGKGHNSGMAADRLKDFVERIERLAEQKSALTGDQAVLYAQAKAMGFDTKVMRQLIRRRKMDDAAREEQDHLLSVYERVFGV